MNLPTFLAGSAVKSPERTNALLPLEAQEVYQTVVDTDTSVQEGLVAVARQPHLIGARSMTNVAGNAIKNTPQAVKPMPTLSGRERMELTYDWLGLNQKPVNPTVESAVPDTPAEITMTMSPKVIDEIRAQVAATAQPADAMHGNLYPTGSNARV